jgi:type IV pilus assembly protein PilE
LKAHKNTRAKNGFTLIELMITTALVGILATLAVPLWHGMRERGLVAVMQADLRNLAVTQESFFIDHEYYASEVSALVNRGFRGTAAVQYSISEATRTGWSATVSHPGTSRRCHLFVGFAAPVGTATRNGVMDCG